MGQRSARTKTEQLKMTIVIHLLSGPSMKYFLSDFL
jgi:hypothetical protein